MKTELTVSEQLRTQISTHLGKLDVRKIDAADKKHAAVAVVIVNQQTAAGIGNIPFDPSRADHAALILTIRASKLKTHAGQRAFPGGRIDAGETPGQAALRELEEEVGLVLRPDQILGCLDDYSTRSGFVITPVVVWAGKTGQMVANPDEVESIHRIPVSEMLREDAPILEPIPGCEHPVLKMPLGDDWFAAPTAAIAFQFREAALLGKPTRVAHFEQPRFAWK